VLKLRSAAALEVGNTTRNYKRSGVARGEGAVGAAPLAENPELHRRVTGVAGIAINTPQKSTM